MPKPTFKPNREIAPLQLAHALTTLMQRYLPVKFAKTRISPAEAWQILSYAAVTQQSVEAACAALPEAPSGNRLREVLLPALPNVPELQRRLNRVLYQQLPRSLFKKKRPFQMAIDLTLIPYHGQAHTAPDEVLRSAAKAGTTHFHGYATLSIVHDKHRYTLLLMFVRRGQTMVEVVRYLLNRLKRLHFKVRRLYLDAGFCSVAVLKTLHRRKLPFLLPIPLRGKAGGVRKLFTRPKSYVGFYTLHSPKAGTWTVKAVALRRYRKGRYRTHGVQWFAYAVSALPRHTPLAQVFEWYRRRFGIETSYRQMHQVRARTTSRKPEWRLLLVGLALILVNLYLTLRRACGVISPASPSRPPRLPVSLRRLATLLRQAAESIFGSPLPLFLRQAVTLS